MPADIRCRGCSESFHAKRSDALWCPSCRGANAKRYAREYDAKDKVSAKTRCMDCTTPIGRNAKRCRTCDNIWRGIRYRGEGSPNWKQGRIVDGKGYVLVRVKPGTHRAGAGAYRREHHVVWEQAHGRPLPKGWIVHHLNGLKADNRPENLAAMRRQEHHTHPRRALAPYEERIKMLEEQLGIG